MLTIPEPIGGGSAFAESLHSVIHRTAALYKVTPARVAELAAVSAGKRFHHSNYSTASEWLGFGELTRNLAQGLERMSRRAGLEQTTLLPAAGVIGQTRNLFARSFRVCPTCVGHAHGIGYSMIAHQLTYVVNCPLHGCRLIDQCLECDKSLGWGVNYLVNPTCTKCKSELSSQRAVPIAIDDYEAWRERQTVKLVELSTNMSSALQGAQWRKDFGRAICRLTTSLENYSPSEKVLVREAAKRYRNNPDSRPSLNTLLQIGVIQAGDLGALLKTPAEALSPRLLDVGEFESYTIPRPTHTKQRWQHAKTVAERLLRETSDDYLPPLSLVAFQCGLTACGMWRHFPELAGAYGRERRRRMRSIAQRRHRLALSAAQSVFRRHAKTGISMEVRRDGREVMMKAGVSKAVAERALIAVSDAWEVMRVDTGAALSAPWL